MGNICKHLFSSHSLSLHLDVDCLPLIYRSVGVTGPVGKPRHPSPGQYPPAHSGGSQGIPKPDGIHGSMDMLAHSNTLIYFDNLSQLWLYVWAVVLLMCTPKGLQQTINVIYYSFFSTIFSLLPLFHTGQI
ncbi:hypothetical protein ILYODFUR_016701 [Ilyodon furcidens]|uniref:Uncharacterized protein n=1 Tax=Ilyodon furcidens TaxID=33524 RepID=A0ABV0USW7_9TELE